MCTTLRDRLSEAERSSSSPSSRAMEIGLAMAAFGAAVEGEISSPSRRSSSSSGCQSGWTLYLEHSANGARCDPAAQQRWMLLQAERAGGGGEHEEEEDSMASDASSGHRPRPRELEADAARRDFELRRHGFVVVDQRSYCYCSTTSGAGHRSSSASGSGRSLGSSRWSRSSQCVGKGGVARRAAAVFQGGDATAATHQYREVIVIDDDDEEEELDDTASSSAVFSCPMAMVHAR